MARHPGIPGPRNAAAWLDSSLRLCQDRGTVVRTMSNMIHHNMSAFGSLHEVCQVRAPRLSAPRLPEPQEPIPVQVRVRQYAEAIRGPQRARSTRPDLGRLPVGTSLDCLM